MQRLRDCGVLSAKWDIAPPSCKVQGSLQKREQKDCKTQKWFKKPVFPGRAGQLYTWTHSHCDRMHKACMSWNPHRTPARRVPRVPKWISSPMLAEKLPAVDSCWERGHFPQGCGCWYVVHTPDRLIIKNIGATQLDLIVLFCFSTPAHPHPPIHTQSFLCNSHGCPGASP